MRIERDRINIRNNFHKMISYGKNIIGSSLGRKVIKGGFWVTIGKASTTITGLISSAIITRVMQPESVGTYYIAISIITTAALIAEMGLGRTTIRLIGEAKGLNEISKIKSTIYTSLVLIFIGIAVVTIIYLLTGKTISILFFKSLELRSITTLTSISIIPTALGSLLSEAYRGLQDFQSSETFEGILKGILISLGLGIILLIRKSATIEEVMLIFIISSGVNAAFALIFINRRLPTSAMNNQTFLFRDLILISLPVFLTEMALFLSSQSFLWVLGFFRSSEEVAVFSIVVKLAALISTPTLLYKQVIAPFIAELFFQGRIQELEKLIRPITTISFSVALFLGLIVFLKGRDLLSLVYGNFYAGGHFALSLIVIGQLISIGTGPCGQLMIMTGNQKKLLQISLLSGITSVIVSIFFVEKFGYVGAAIGLLTYMAMNNLITTYEGFRKIGVKSWIGY